MAEKVYTTGQLSKLLQVAPRTVSMWFDSGRLQGYRLPSAGGGRGDRRIAQSKVIEFMQTAGLPLSLLDGEGSSGAIRLERTMTQAIDNLKDFIDNRAYDRDRIRSDCNMVLTSYETMIIGDNDA